MAQALRLWSVKLLNGGQVYQGSGTILGGLICLQQQQVAFWEDQFQRMKSDSSEVMCAALRSVLLLSLQFVVWKKWTNQQPQNPNHKSAS